VPTIDRNVGVLERNDVDRLRQVNLGMWVTSRYT